MSSNFYEKLAMALKMDLLTISYLSHGTYDKKVGKVNH